MQKPNKVFIIIAIVLLVNGIVLITSLKSPSNITRISGIIELITLAIFMYFNFKQVKEYKESVAQNKGQD